MPDKYRNFEELLKHEVCGKDFNIRIEPRDSKVAIIAPHGGEIEPGTSLIAATIADDRFQLYCFEGLRKRPHGELHVTSHFFDENECLALLDKCDFVLTIHGRRDGDDAETIYLGGLDVELRNKIGKSLLANGFQAQTDDHKFPGREPTNICNRGRRGMGVQLEFPRSLRNELTTNSKRLQRLAGAICRCF